MKNKIAYTIFVALLSSLLTVIAVDLLRPGHPPATDADRDPDAGSAGGNVSAYTLDQVAEHDSPRDCWKVIDGEVYDVTGYVARHPADTGVLAEWCGREATAAWEGRGGAHEHSSRARRLLERYRIGTLKAD